MAISTFAQTLADAKTLRQKYVGSGGFPTPGISSYENTLATAIVMNELGRRSVRNGTGKFYGHNHQGEFRTQYADPETGEMKSAWQILVENTDPRYVAFQLDVLWATDGGADPVALLERYGRRIFSLHVKDGINVADPANATPVPMGQGEMVFEPILRAAERYVEFYIYEQDPPFGDPTFDPFASAQRGVRIPRPRPLLRGSAGGAARGPARAAPFQAGPGTQLVPASGTRAIAAASTVSATRSSGSRLCTCDLPHARASVCVSSVIVRR